MERYLKEYWPVESSESVSPASDASNWYNDFLVATSKALWIPSKIVEEQGSEDPNNWSFVDSEPQANEPITWADLRG